MTARIIESVRSLASTPTLLVALDFDGTVSHLADDPMGVRAIPAAQSVIDTLSRLDDTYVAFVSGRSLRDLRIISEHPPVSPIILVGSHGAEYLLPPTLAANVAEDDLSDGEQLHAEVGDALRLAVEDFADIQIEPKRYGYAVHSRQAEPSATRQSTRAADAVVRQLAPEWRRRAGRDVVEYSSRSEGKDNAVARLREITGATAVLFAGDDVTDEDVLSRMQPQDLGIHVGSGDSAATISVADPEELAVVLEVIASIRARRA